MTHSPAMWQRSIRQTNNAAVSTEYHGRGTTATLSRRHAQASKSQVRMRPVQTSATGDSQSDSQPNVK